MLEQLITDLINALKENTAAQLASKGTVPAKEKKGRAATIDASINAGGTATPLTASEANAATTPSTPETPAITIADVRALQSKLMDEGLIEKVKEVNAKMGVKRAADLPADKVAEAYALLQAIKIDVPAEQPATPAPEEAKKEPVKSAAAPTVTIDELKALAIKLRDAGHVEKIKAVINPLGVMKVTETPADKIAAVHAGLTKALADVANEDPTA